MTEGLKSPLFLFMLLLIGILFFAFSPGQWTPAWVVNHDKFVHFAVFFLLSVFLSYVFPLLNLLTHFILLLFFAILIEVVQFSLFSRGFSIEDILFGALGVLLFYLLVFLAKKI